MSALKAEEIQFVSGGGVIEEVVVNGSSSFGGWYSSAYGVGAESYATEQSIYEAEASVDQYLDGLLVLLGAGVLLISPPPAAAAGAAVALGIVAKPMINANMKYLTEIQREAGSLG